MSKVTVAVRVRPMNEMEQASDVTEVIEVDHGMISVTREFEGEKTFNFDIAYSSRVGSVSYGNNAKIYTDIGVKILDDAIAGYNGCLFAYGQTGSGKSYTMMGYEDPGVIPRITEDLFLRVKNEKERRIKVWVSYLEIYNEKIRDLLRPVGSEDDNLNIYEHQDLGVIVPDATVSPAYTFEEARRLMAHGLKNRASAATAMNATSSRSHSIYTLHVETGKSIAKINLIDLAGSERLSKSHGASDGPIHKEATMINQSLTNLGLVIKALSDKKQFVPYRNSKLTFLLKDSLAGNSRTYMIAAVSPAISELEETIGTLRFASSVKTLVTNPHVNFGSHEDIVNALRAEIAQLKQKLATDGTMKVKSAVLKMIKASFDKRIHQVSGAIATLSPKSGRDRGPYLLNVSEDPLLFGALVFPIFADSSSIGSEENKDQIFLAGPGMVPQMALIELTTDGVFVTKRNGSVFVNGRRLGEKSQLMHNGDVLVCGCDVMLRLVVPTNRVLSNAFSSQNDVLTQIEFSLRRCSFLATETVAAVMDTAARMAPKIDQTRHKLGLFLGPNECSLIMKVKTDIGTDEFWSTDRFERPLEQSSLVALLQKIAEGIETLENITNLRNTN